MDLALLPRRFALRREVEAFAFVLSADGQADHGRTEFQRVPGSDEAPSDRDGDADDLDAEPMDAAFPQAGCAPDPRRRDDGERHLIGHEQHFRDRPGERACDVDADPRQEGAAEPAEIGAVPTEGERMGECEP